MTASINQPLMVPSIFKNYENLHELAQTVCIAPSFFGGAAFFISDLCGKNFGSPFAYGVKFISAPVATGSKIKAENIQKYKWAVAISGIAIGALTANFFYSHTNYSLARGFIAGLHTATIVSLLSSEPFGPFFLKESKMTSSVIVVKKRSLDNILLISRIHLVTSVAFTYVLQNPILGNTIGAIAVVVSQAVDRHFNK